MPLNIRRYSAVAEEVRSCLPSGSLLDIGCGTGLMLVEIARTNPGLKLIGIDVSESMITLGRRNISEAGLSDVITLASRSAEDLSEFGDERFDMVTSSGCLSAWLSPEETLRQIHRIMKNGGRLLLRDWNRRTSFFRKALLLLEASRQPEVRKRIRTAFKAAYTLREVQEIVMSGPLTIEELRTEDHWLVCRLVKKQLVSSS